MTTTATYGDLTPISPKGRYTVKTEGTTLLGAFKLLNWEYELEDEYWVIN